MPSIGEIVSAKKAGKRGTNLFIWMECPKCGKPRWVQTTNAKKTTFTGLCQKCCGWQVGQPSEGHRGELNPNWKGGRFKTGHGYIAIRLQPDDFFYPMANQRHYVFEHRLAMARHLGRCLHLWEIIHHKNHIRDDNRIENLQLVSDNRHTQITLLENKIAKLEREVAEHASRIILIETENILLREMADDMRWNKQAIDVKELFQLA